MCRSLIVFVLGAALLAGHAPDARAEDAVVGPGSQVRVSTGGAREIPGVVALTKQGVATPGAIVAHDSRLVAVQMPDEAIAVALPRPGARPIGRLVAFDDDSVVIRFEGHTVPFRVPRDVITRLEVNRGGRRNVLKSAGIGLAVGALAGVAVGIASGNDEPGLLAFSAGEKAAIAGAGLGVAGAVVGLVAGVARRGPRWEAVEPGKRVGVFVEPRRNGGARAELRVVF
jgi:hypothetical protein